MKYVLPSLAGLSALLLTSACSSETQVNVEGPISIETMQEVTRTLSSDEFAGREPGTPGGHMTLDYLAEQFAAAGLQPGNGDSWFQEVPLIEITSNNFSPLRVGGNAFSFGDDWVGVSYPQVPNTQIADSELVFVGYGINAPEKGWNDYAGIDMTGKTALILVNDPDFADEGLDGPFKGRAMTYYGRWTYKYEEAARQGAAAALVIHEDFAASYGWNVVEGGWSGPQAYAGGGTRGMDQTQMNGWVSNQAARTILSASDLDLDELTSAASQEGFSAISLGQNLSVSFTNSIREFTSKNVIGIVPGTERPDEYVLHTAHWDHLGLCGDEGAEDQICNGAIDNATGTAALVALGAAHVESGATERTQVFLAVTAEESGLLGAEYYASDPVFPLSQTVGGVNIDALYVMGEAHNVVSIGSGKSQLDGYLQQATDAQGRSISTEANPQAGRYYRSDHFSLAKRGVPMLYLKPGQNLVEGGEEAGAAWYANYNDNLYHAPADEYGEDWDWRGVESDLQLYFAVSRLLGAAEEWPNWYPEDEFRLIRDESCAAEGGC